jgi:hypothetical protein
MSPSAEPFVRDEDFVPVPDEITAHDLPVASTLPPHVRRPFRVSVSVKGGTS